MFGKMKNSMAMPGAKMSNNTLERPASGGVMGPPKLKMPETAGASMPHGIEMAPHLGPKLNPLPQHPMMPPKPGATPSLFHTNGMGKSPLHGLRK